MKTLLLILFLTFNYNCLAQTILNGSFEDNTLNNDFHYSFTSESFSTSVNNIFGFANNDTLTLCMKNGSSQEGQWNLILYDVLEGDNLNYPDNFISLKLSQPLVVGKNYRVSYYIRRHQIIQFPPPPGPQTEMTNGLSIGYSNDSSNVGVTLFSSSAPISFTDWEYQYKEFRCYHDSIQYNTVKMKDHSMCGPRYVCQIDNFELTTLASISEQDESSIYLYPNPTKSGIVYVQNNEAQYLSVYDLMGKLRHQQNLNPHQENTFSISHLDNGIYTIRFWNKDKLLHQDRVLKL